MEGWSFWIINLFLCLFIINMLCWVPVFTTLSEPSSRTSAACILFLNKTKFIHSTFCSKILFTVTVRNIRRRTSADAAPAIWTEPNLFIQLFVQRFTLLTFIYFSWNHRQTRKPPGPIFNGKPVPSSSQAELVCKIGLKLCLALAQSSRYIG